MMLVAPEYYYIPSGASGLAGSVIEPTPELLKLQADLIAGVAQHDYLDSMLAEPFAAFTFSPAGAAGKQLRAWD